jgi:hypothetical protein
VPVSDRRDTVNALDLRDDFQARYQFQVIGDTADDPFARLARLIAKMRRALAIHHVDNDASGPCIADHKSEGI